MPLRVLVIGPKEREAAHKLVEFAARPENHYRPGPDAFIPGDNPKFVLRLTDLRCVFTFTEAKGLWRHLSVSVPDQNAMPHPAMVEEIGRLFGFKKSLRDWQMHGDRKTNSVVVLQKV